MILTVLLQHLSAATWDWTVASADRVAVQLGGEPVDEVVGRTSYRMDGVVDLSLYWEDGCAEFLEITLNLFSEPHLLDPAEYEKKEDEYFRKYRNAVAEARKVLGAPIFDGGAGSSSFPCDQEAYRLALWALPNARLMVQQKHEDKELPFRVCIVVAPLAISE